MLEQALRQSLSMGGITIFLSRPVAIFFIALAVIMVIVSWKYLRHGVRESD